MKHPFYTMTFLCCILWIASCTGPVIIDDTSTGQDDSTLESDPHRKDSVVIIHEGTYSSPYTIAEAQASRSTKSVWIEGYIVGTVSGSIKSGCNYSQKATIQSNILLADTFPTGDENDYQLCLPIELPNGSIERDELNLYDNPNNYHRKIRLQGDITLYYKVVGIKKIADYIFCDEDVNEDVNENENKNEEEGENENQGENESEDTNGPSNPDATRQDTLSIAEGIKLQKEDGYEQACIRGYIIGYAKGNNSIAYVDPATVITRTAERNVVLADNLDERDNKKIIVVQLPEGFIRDDVNLYANPQNLHKRLTVIGIMTYYYGLAGCTETLGTENRERFHLE